MNTALLLTRAAMAFPDRPALRFGSQTLTYRDLEREAGQFAAALRANGLSQGDRVAIAMRNRLEYVVALFGVFKAGFCVVPVNARLHPRETEWILGNADVAALVTDSDELDAPLVIRPDADWDAFLASAGAPLPDQELEGTELAWLFYTSGTTGFPKGAMLSHRCLMAMTMSCLAEVCDYQPDDIVLHPAPLSHGCGLYLLPSLARGADNHIYAPASFDPDDVIRTIVDERITCISFMAPTQIVRLLHSKSAGQTPSLRRLVYGGAPIHVEHAREALARFGPVLCQIYGQGEAPMTISALAPQEHTAEGLASAGFPRANVEVRIIDGEIAVRGDVVMSGYWRNPEATEQALRNGWLHTGDLGEIDGRGRIILLDRKNDMIISGGANIYPREVEDVLVQHRDVLEASVFGVPDPVWGEAVVGAIVLRDGAEVDPARLAEFCKAHLASFKKPKHIAVMDALPKNAYGKVSRRELRERYLANRSPDA